MSNDSNPSALPTKILFLLFFISGFCSLLYQLVWVRLAFASFGVNTPVLSAVLSFFMAGLALGSWWGGLLASRSFHRWNSIRVYAFLEIFIAMGAFAVPRLFSFGADQLLSAGNGGSGLYLFLSALVIFLALLPWCICMGATFPFMMAFIEKNGGSKESFSFLYTANVLGAMTGTVMTAYILIECLGLRGTGEAAAGLNLLIALTALKLSSRYSSSAVAPEKVSSSQNETLSGLPSAALYASILFTTGFVFMAMEVVWTRCFTWVLHTEVYSYASLLFTYLFSTFAGSWLYRRYQNTLNLSLGVLWGILFCCALLPVILSDPRIYQSSLTVLLSIVPVCSVLGYLTPLIIDKVSLGNPAAAGRAYALNVLGCILGPLAASYFFLPFLGTRASLTLLSLFLALFFINPALRSFSLSARTFLGFLGAGLLAVSIFWSLDYEDCYQRFFPETQVRRDYCATVVSRGEGKLKELLVNGVGMTGLVMPTKVMAHLPLVLLPHTPQSALDICFGMGTSFRSLLSWNIETTAVDLVPSVLKSFGYYWPDADRLRALPRAHLVVDDGRRFLKRTRDSFDVITVDPPPPLQAAASSLLYSTEFYDLVKQHLKKGGLLQQWLPIGGYGVWPAVARSINVSFPYVKAFSATERDGVYFIASLEPIHIPTFQEIKAKMPPSALRDLSEWKPGQRAAVDYLKNILSHEQPIEVFTDSSGPEMITDDRPFNEYYFLRKWKWDLFHRPW